jgi:hypothetical protein
MDPLAIRKGGEMSRGVVDATIKWPKISLHDFQENSLYGIGKLIYSLYVLVKLKTP